MTNAMRIVFFPSRMSDPTGLPSSFSSPNRPSSSSRTWKSRPRLSPQASSFSRTSGAAPAIERPGHAGGGKSCSGPSCSGTSSVSRRRSHRPSRRPTRRPASGQCPPRRAPARTAASTSPSARAPRDARQQLEGHEVGHVTGADALRLPHVRRDPRGLPRPAICAYCWKIDGWPRRTTSLSMMSSWTRSPDWNSSIAAPAATTDAACSSRRRRRRCSPRRRWTTRGARGTRGPSCPAA